MRIASGNPPGVVYAGVMIDWFQPDLKERIADGGHNRGVSFAWADLNDLKGRKITGAGLNLNGLKLTGVSADQSVLGTA